MSIMNTWSQKIEHVIKIRNDVGVATSLVQRTVLQLLSEIWGSSRLCLFRRKHAYRKGLMAA